MLGRSALLAATNALDYGNWLGNYSDVSLLLRNGTPQLVPLDESPTQKTLAISPSGSNVISTFFKYGTSSLLIPSGGQISGTDDQTLSGNYTVEGWFYNWSNASLIIGTETAGRVQFIVTPTAVQIERFGTSVYINSSTGIGTNQWAHVAWCKSGATTRIFVNGTQTASVNDGFSSIGNAGQYRIISSGGTGYIDDFRITKGIARYETGTGANAGKMVFAGTNNLADPDTFGEFQTNSGPNPDPNWNNVSLLLRNGTPVLVPFDESPRPKTITAFGNALVTTAVARWNQGSGGSSLAFDGSGGDYFWAPASAEFLFPEDHTIECWIYWDGTYVGPGGGGRNMYGTGGAGSLDQFGIFSGVGLFWGGVFNNVPANYPPINQWAHVAASRQGSTIRLFINGALTASGTQFASIGSSTAVAVVGARLDDFHPFKGYIDDFRITKGVARYTSNFTPPPAELPNF